MVNSRTSERVGLPNRSVRMDEIICCTQGQNIYVKNRVQILKGTIKFNPANSYCKKKAGGKKIERQSLRLWDKGRKNYGRMWVTGKSDSYLLWCDRYEWQETERKFSA